MSNTNKEWLDLVKHPAKPGYKWRAQEADGQVFDYSARPKADASSWDAEPQDMYAEYVGLFEVTGDWKDMCFNLKDIAEKQIKTPLPVTNPQCINHFSPRSVNTNDILTVISFAAERHKNQRRKDKDATPYINHPLAVAKLLSDHGVTDQDTIFAALLHDVVEDTETTYEELVLLFGQAVAEMVMEVTDDKSLPKAERKRQQVETASSKSLGARLIKIADKTHNLQSIIDAPPHNWTPERVKEYFDWSKQVVDQMRGTHADLEALFDCVYEECNHKVKVKYYVAVDPHTDLDCLYSKKPKWNKSEEVWGMDGFIASYQPGKLRTGFDDVDFCFEIPGASLAVLFSQSELDVLEPYLAQRGFSQNN